MDAAAAAAEGTSRRVVVERSTSADSAEDPRAPPIQVIFRSEEDGEDDVSDSVMIPMSFMSQLGSEEDEGEEQQLVVVQTFQLKKIPAGSVVYFVNPPAGFGSGQIRRKKKVGCRGKAVKDGKQYVSNLKKAMKKKNLPQTKTAPDVKSTGKETEEKTDVVTRDNNDELLPEEISVLEASVEEIIISSTTHEQSKQVLPVNEIDYTCHEVITISDDDDDDDQNERRASIITPIVAEASDDEPETLPALRIKNLAELQSPKKLKKVVDKHEEDSRDAKITDARRRRAKKPRVPTWSWSENSDTVEHPGASLVLPCHSPTQPTRNLEESMCEEIASMNSQQSSLSLVELIDDTEITISTILGLPNKAPQGNIPSPGQPPKKRPRKEKHQLRMCPTPPLPPHSFGTDSPVVATETDEPDCVQSTQEPEQPIPQISKNSSCPEFQQILLTVNSSPTSLSISSDSSIPCANSTLLKPVAGVWRVCSDCGVLINPSRLVNYSALSCDHSSTKELTQQELKKLSVCTSCHQVIKQGKLRLHRLKNSMCRKSNKPKRADRGKKVKKVQNNVEDQPTKSTAQVRDQYRVVNDFSSLHQCGVCAKWLDSLISLKCHVMNDHSRIANCITFYPVYMCRRCEAEFADSFELVVHAENCTALISAEKYASQAVM